MKKGEIFVGRESTHPVIFLESKSENEFIGILLTHAHTIKESKPFHLEEKYFKQFENKDEKYSFLYDDDLLPQKCLVNIYDWGPFHKVGNLSASGEKFFDEHIDDLDPLGWGELKSYS